MSPSFQTPCLSGIPCRFSSLSCRHQVHCPYSPVSQVHYTCDPVYSRPPFYEMYGPTHLCLLLPEPPVRFFRGLCYLLKTSSIRDFTIRSTLVSRTSGVDLVVRTTFPLDGRDFPFSCGPTGDLIGWDCVRHVSGTPSRIEPKFRLRC